MKCADASTVGCARTNVTGSSPSFVIASVRSSIHCVHARENFVLPLPLVIESR